jgi:lysophospholipase L1-like esterase
LNVLPASFLRDLGEGTSTQLEHGLSLDRFIEPSKTTQREKTMIHDKLEFHNVVELTKRENFSGLQLQRIPAAIHKHLYERGRWNAQMSCGTEIRCVTDSDNLRLFISTLEGDTELWVYQGDFFHSKHYITPGKTHCIHVSPAPRLKEVKPEALAGRRFAPDVWRFAMSGLFPMFHGLDVFDHAVRPPNADEKPKTRWLSYGSSITAGTGSTSPHLSYVQQTAWRLGVDVLNLGQGGACMCEPQLADFHASRGDWDFATLEIGVNMLNFFTTEQFINRATYLINAMLKKNPGKPVVVITPYPNSHHFLPGETPISKRQQEYTAFLKDFVAASDNENLHLIDGFEILTDFCGLNVDLIHPFDTGMTQMAENLARKLNGIPSVRSTIENGSFLP